MFAHHRPSIPSQAVSGAVKRRSIADRITSTAELINKEAETQKRLLKINDFFGKRMSESEPRMENNEDTEEFTVIDPSEINSECQLFQDQDDVIESVMEKFDGLQLELSQTDIDEVVTELKLLEEKLHLWREVRLKTIAELRDIADYIDKVAKQTGIAKVVGSGGGVLAGGLTLAGGVMTVLTAGAALPVLAAGAGLGLASGLTGASAALSKKILSSKQMTKVQLAIEVDSEATKELLFEVETVKEDTRVRKVASVVFTVGSLASSTKGLMDIVRGATPGNTILAGLESIGQIFGENINKEIVKLLARTSGQVLSGTVTSVFGGVTMLWDMYQLKTGVTQIVEGGEEAAEQIRDIATQLEQGLREFGDQGSADGAEENNNSPDDSKPCDAGAGDENDVAGV